MIKKFKNKLNLLDEHTLEVIIKSIPSIFVKIGGMVMALIVSVVLGRLLGAEGLGIINLTTKIGSVLVMLALLGTPQLLIKSLAIAVNQRNWQDVNNLMKSGVLLNTLSSLAVILPVIFLTPWLANNVFEQPNLEVPLIIAECAVFFQVLSRVYASGLIAYKKIWQSNLVNEALSMAVVALMLGVLYFFQKSINVISVAILYFFGRVTVTIFVTFYWRKLFKHKTKFKNKTKQLLRQSLPFLLVSATGIIASNIDSIMVGWLSTVEEVAYYTVSSRLAMLTIFFLQVVNSSLSPKLATLYKNGNIEEMNKMVQRVTTGLLIVSLFPVILFLIFGEAILGVWGDEFKVGYWLLIVLSLGQLVNIGTGSAGLILVMTGFEKIQANISIIAIVINLIINLILISSLGALGAAIATAIALSFENITKVIYAKKRTGVMTVPKLF